MSHITRNERPAPHAPLAARTALYTVTYLYEDVLYVLVELRGRFGQARLYRVAVHAGLVRARAARQLQPQAHLHMSTQHRHITCTEAAGSHESRQQQHAHCHCQQPPGGRTEESLSHT